MINDLWNGKYAGLIAWHPVRLAGNMKEAGEIIDMLDHLIIKNFYINTLSTGWVWVPNRKPLLEDFTSLAKKLDGLGFR